MGIVFYILSLVLSAFDFLLLVRAVCSWVPSFRDSFVFRISYTITEPILGPVRDILFRIEWVRRCPIDLSFLAVLLLVNALSGAVNYLYYMLG